MNRRGQIIGALILAGLIGLYFIARTRGDHTLFAAFVIAGLLAGAVIQWIAPSARNGRDVREESRPESANSISWQYSWLGLALIAGGAACAVLGPQWLSDTYDSALTVAVVASTLAFVGAVIVYVQGRAWFRNIFK